MASIDPEEKRPRLSSWNGSAHNMRVQHPPDLNTHLPAHQLPSPVQPAYYEPENRELPDPSSHPFKVQSGYSTPVHHVATSYPPDQGFGRPAGTQHMKSRSPVETHSQQQHPQHQHHQQQQMSSLPVSTGNGSSRPMQYPADPPAAPAYPEHQSNGIHQAVSMATHDPMPPPPPMGYAPSPVTAGPSEQPYYMGGAPVSFATSSSFATQPRRKAIRAAQACDACRQRKARCDEGRPSCGFCKEANAVCVYRDVPPAKQDRTMLQLLHSIEDLKASQAMISDHTMAQLVSSIEDLKAEVQELKTGPSASRPPPDTPTSSAPQVSSTKKASRPTNISPEPARRLGHGANAEAGERREQRLPPPGEQLDDDDDDDDEDRMEDVPDDMGDLSIPLEHTTAAHKLLRWPSIKRLMSRVASSEEYVMESEERRGLLRLYGRGEGVDASTHDPRIASSDAGSSDESAGSPPPVFDGRWGTTFAGAGDIRQPATECLGGLNVDGSLQLDISTITRLAESYLQNVHIMHPFLDRERVIQMVQELGLRHSGICENRTSQASPNLYAVSDMRRDSVGSVGQGSKRKRSAPYGSLGSPVLGPGGGSARVPLERSIGTAIILLVCALGKICEHKQFLPPLPSDSADYPPSGLPSPTTMGGPQTFKPSPSSSQSSSFNAAPSPQENGRYRGPLPRDGRAGAPKNVDVVPGLAYYAAATEIIGNLLGGNDLSHVQAMLLAGLYAGQLARVFESWKWINNACTACQVLVRPVKFDNETNPVRKELITTCFWTALQLESDILAELDLPQSGITRYEYTMPFPKGKPGEELMWTYYLAQIGLRKLLNRVHSSLYKPKPPDKDDAEWSIHELLELSRQLSEWREHVPKPLQWDDSDPPPAEINAARLRAKYYGARYVIHRPFLHYAIHPIDSQPAPYQPNGALPGSASPPSIERHTGTSGISGKPRESVAARPEQSVIDACRNCINAAFRSTSAFHGIRPNFRPLVTNIHGTAHAQFGNLLVLTVASRSPVLAELVPQEDYSRLLQRTIAFLRHLAPISPTLKTDAIILERCQQLQIQNHGSSSFSSNDGPEGY
ncbi:MAG: hypothetical protein M1817_000943 [Caeruleum heppii]|nr:MAG: hypothetical protein M1817_000943 [Caeruleum heppii]